MGLHTADAIVLRRYLYRETSVIVACLTDRYGKLKGLVKGLRAHPNRHRSAMEPLTVNRIVFYDTRSSQLHLISQCDLLSPLAELQRDLEVARVAGLFVDLVDTVVPLEEPQPLIYALLKHTLEHLALAPHERLSLRIHFIARLLKLTGFQPQLDECTGCGSHVEATGYWSAQQGGLLCAACLHEDPRAVPAPSHTLEALSQLAHADGPISLEEPLVPLLNRQLDEFLRWRLDRPLKTLEAEGSTEAVVQPSASSLEPR